MLGGRTAPFPTPMRFELLAFLTLSPLAAAQGDFTVLGNSLTPSAVSGDGSLVAGTGSGQYWLWSAAGGLQFIGGLEPGNGVGGQASVSFDGTEVGGTLLNPATGQYEAGRYSVAAGSWMPLGGLGGSSGQSTSSGWGTSGDGRVAVGLGWINPGVAHGFTYSAATGMVDLGSSVPDRSTRANDADYDGDVVVGWQDGVSGFRQGALWRDGVQTLIFDGGAPMGELGCVSADGRWAGGLGVFANGQEAYLWSEGSGVVNLGHLNPTHSGAVTGISADGSFVVGFDRPFGPAVFGRGFAWTEQNGMVDLNDLAQFFGIDVGGAVLSLPLAVSADGRTIVGQGLQGFQTIAWRLELPEPDCGYAGYGYGASAINELVLTGIGTPEVDGELDLLVTNAFAGQASIALAGAAADLPVGGVVALVDPLSLFGLFTASPSPDGAQLLAPIPNNPGLAGALLFAQAIAFEPSQPGLLAASNGLSIEVCP